MKYTKEQLQAMSDFEVNKALLLLTLDEDDLPVVWASGVEFYEECGSIFQDSVEVGDYGRYTETEEIDYCNTPNDIMPLAFEHEITITTQAQPFYGDNFVYDKEHPDYNKALLESRWVACQVLSADYDCQIYSHDHRAAYCDDNPLRAITCCLILVLQGEK